MPTSVRKSSVSAAGRIARDRLEQSRRWFGQAGREAGDEVERVEDDGPGTSSASERRSLAIGYRGEVASEAFASGIVVALKRNLGVERECGI